MMQRNGRKHRWAWYREMRASGAVRAKGQWPRGPARGGKGGGGRQWGLCRGAEDKVWGQHGSEVGGGQDPRGEEVKEEPTKSRQGSNGDWSQSKNPSSAGVAWQRKTLHDGQARRVQGQQKGRGLQRGGGEPSRGMRGVVRAAGHRRNSSTARAGPGGPGGGGEAPRAGGEGSEPVVPGTGLGCRGDTQESPQGLPASRGFRPPTTAPGSTQAQGTHGANGGHELRPWCSRRQGSWSPQGPSTPSGKHMGGGTPGWPDQPPSSQALCLGSPKPEPVGC